MTARPGELAPSTPNDPSQSGAEASGATASFLAELRGGGSDGGPGPGPERRSKFSGPTLMVLGVLAVGIAILLGMRRFAISGAGEFNPVKIDYTPNADAAARAKKNRAILDTLERSGTPVQVPPEEIKKNPFELATKPQVDVVAARTDVEASAKNASDRARRVTDALASLSVNGVMGGPTPLARINGETVIVGDTVADGLFRVKAIEGRTVILECDGRDYQLEMSASKAPGVAPRRR